MKNPNSFPRRFCCCRGVAFVQPIPDSAGAGRGGCRSPGGLGGWRQCIDGWIMGDRKVTARCQSCCTQYTGTRLPPSQPLHPLTCISSFGHIYRIRKVMCRRNHFPSYFVLPRHHIPPFPPPPHKQSKRRGGYNIRWEMRERGLSPGCALLSVLVSLVMRRQVFRLTTTSHCNVNNNCNKDGCTRQIMFWHPTT